MNIGPMTEVSLLLGTIICLGAFFLIDNNIPAQALHKEEQLLEDDDDLADFSNAVRNGDNDLEEIQIQSMEAADIYNDADDNMKDCIGPATEVGHSLSNREVIHCVDDANYFQNKYSSISTNSTVRANTTFATSTAVPDTDNDTAIDTTSTSDTSTSDTSTSDTSTSDTSTSDTSTSDTSTSDTSTSDTSTSDTSTSDTSTSDTSTSDTSTSDTSTSDTSTSDTSITDIPTSDTSITDIPTSDDTTIPAQIPALMIRKQQALMIRKQQALMIRKQQALMIRKQQALMIRKQQALMIRHHPTMKRIKTNLQIITTMVILKTTIV